MWYFIRHGETDWNRKRLFQGAVDIKLNENGREQARKAADVFKKDEVNISRVYSSPLDRAIETAEIVSGIKRDKFTIDDRLIEMSFGIYEGTIYDLAKEDNSGVLGNPEEYFPSPEEKVETYQHIMERTKSFIDDLYKNEAGSDDNILIQTHGACMRALLTNLRGTPLSEFWHQEVHNCQAFIFEPVSDRIIEKGTLNER